MKTNLHLTCALPSDGCNASILYVEDEPFVRQVTSEVLKAAGFRVFVTSNFNDAVRLHEDMPTEIDALLTDVILPGKSGLALATELRRANPSLRVLYVTGYGNLMIPDLEAHADWLAKPFSGDELLYRLKNLLQESADFTAFQPSLAGCVA